MRFSLFAYRFAFQAVDPVWFPPGKAANTIRGALGTIFRHIDERAYTRLFEPAASGPSGLAAAPRPFVIRASALDGHRIEAGGEFTVGVNVFDLQEPSLGAFVSAFTELARTGLGGNRARVVLREVHSSQLHLPLAPPGEPVSRLAVHFITPTELKGEGRILQQPEFGVLFARIRDRVSTLRSLYGEGPLEIDFSAMGGRAAGVRMAGCRLKHESYTRRSSRTGQVHPIGGFTGEARYEGDLTEFVPYLQAACWTGVGRQTQFGKGEIRVLIE